MNEEELNSFKDYIELLAEIESLNDEDV